MKYTAFDRVESFYLILLLIVDPVRYALTTGKQKLENFEILQLIYHTKIARICGKFYDGASYFLAHHQFCPCLALNAVYVHTIIA